MKALGFETYLRVVGGKIPKKAFIHIKLLPGFT